MKYQRGHVAEFGDDTIIPRVLVICILVVAIIVLFAWSDMLAANRANAERVTPCAHPRAVIERIDKAGNAVCVIPAVRI